MSAPGDVDPSKPVAGALAAPRKNILLACERCRGQKLRCNWSNQRPDACCDRCTRLRVSCVRNPQRRLGRPRIRLTERPYESAATSTHPQIVVADTSVVPDPVQQEQTWSGDRPQLQQDGSWYERQGLSNSSIIEAERSPRIASAHAQSICLYSLWLTRVTDIVISEHTRCIRVPGFITRRAFIQLLFVQRNYGRNFVESVSIPSAS